MQRYALRDDQWTMIEDFLPGREGHVGGTAADNRLFVDAVIYRYRTGIPSMIGVGKGSRPPLPPNRTGGFPAYGSPVGGFLIGTVSRSGRPCEVRTARQSRRKHLASGDGRLDSSQHSGVSPACAEALATGAGSSCRYR